MKRLGMIRTSTHGNFPQTFPNRTQRAPRWRQDAQKTKKTDPTSLQVGFSNRNKSEEKAMHKSIEKSMHLGIDFQVLNNCCSAFVKNKHLFYAKYLKLWNGWKSRRPDLGPGHQNAMIEESRRVRANGLMPPGGSKEYHVALLANVNYVDKDRTLIYATNSVSAWYILFAEKNKTE